MTKRSKGLRPAAMGRLALACLALPAAMACNRAAAQDAPCIYLSQSEWQGAVLTESGRQIVLDVVKSAAAAPVTLFDINALADIGATPASQRRLSDARAAAAREELVRAGVAPGEIAVQAVETADGGVPPLPPGESRRVVIVVHY
jgi:hypothetical protein